MSICLLITCSSCKNSVTPKALTFIGSQIFSLLFGLASSASQKKKNTQDKRKNHSQNTLKFPAKNRRKLLHIYFKIFPQTEF